MSLGEYLAALGRGVDLVAEAAGMTPADLEAMGARPSEAASLAALAATYFGKAPYSKKQRQAVAAARERRHCLATLRVIEGHVGKVRGALDAWNLRLELCRVEAAQIERVARRRLKELEKPREYSERATLTQHPGGLATLRVTADSAELTDVYAGIDQQRPGASFLDCVRGGAPRSEIVTMAVLQFDDWCRILGGAGDELRVQLTNGATMTGAQLVERACLDRGYVAAVSRVNGPLELYQTSRFASPKQRALLAAESPRCAWPGCRTPVERCQFHHILGWKHGGPTNVGNLVPLCAYHNGVNDDDPNAPPRRGRMARVGGRVAWLPPGGGPPVFTSPFN